MATIRVFLTNLLQKRRSGGALTSHTAGGAYLEQFRQHEADNIALSVKFNRWSLTMVESMIREQEQKLVASDLPVEGTGVNDFWEEAAGLGQRP